MVQILGNLPALGEQQVRSENEASEGELTKS